MFIHKNKEITIKYDLENINGTLLSSASQTGPLSMPVGKGYFHPAIERELIGHKVGNKIQKVLQPHEAFGFYKERLLREFNLSNFQNDEELELGAYVHIFSPTGVRKAQICDLKGDMVTLDLNHQFASQTLRYSIEILNISNTSKEPTRNIDFLELFTTEVPQHIFQH